MADFEAKRGPIPLQRRESTGFEEKPAPITPWSLLTGGVALVFVSLVIPTLYILAYAYEMPEIYTWGNGAVFVVALTYLAVGYVRSAKPVPVATDRSGITIGTRRIRCEDIADLGYHGVSTDGESTTPNWVILTLVNGEHVGFEVADRHEAKKHAEALADLWGLVGW